MRNWSLLTFLVFIPYFLFSQCPNPIDVNLTSNPSASFNSSYATIGPLTTSNTCCPNFAVAGERCLKFSITLHPDAKGIRFEMNPTVSSATYRINCGSTAVNVGSTVCLQGPGPHVLTFCNPAQITSLFKITSIPKATAGPDISISQGCSKKINSIGFDSTSSVTWTSITNSTIHNSYLSCTNCLKPTVTPGVSPPAFVDYKVCGNSVCGQVCDTVRVFFTPPLAVSITPANPAICFNQTPNSTTITANGTGGSGTYSYLWNNINSSQTITVPGGFYTVVMSDGSGCSATSIVEVKKFNVAPSANAGPDKTVCKVSPTTMLNGTVTGATGGIWSGGGGTFSPNNTTLNATYTPTPLELTTGFVDLTLTTSGSGTCQAASDIVRISYDNFTGVVTVVPTAVNCFGGNNGSAIVNVTGGSPPHTYSWNTVPAQTAATATNLALGTYSVTVTNSIGCTSTATAVITQPASIALASTITPVTCSGGSNGALGIITTGGTPPFTYLWQPGGQTTATINGKQAGSYTVTVTDSKGCPLQGNYTINQPPAIAIAFTPTAVSCFNGIDGKAASIVTGGTTPYSYNWSSGATSPDASGLQAGTHTLTVTDNLGCTGSNTVTITQPVAFIANTTTVSESCNYSNDGSATVAAAGGNPGYTYQWQPGALTSTNITNLSSGTYTVTATDSKGCTATGFATVNEPVQLVVNFISQVNVSCFSGNDGFVTASPVGGTFPYTYSWSPGGTTTASRNGLTAGTYSVTVTDSKGCTATGTVTITEPSALLTVSNSTITDASCNGGANGSIAITPAGGTSPYTYLWMPGNQTGSTATNLAAGTYTLTLKDSKGCQISSNYTVNEPAATNVSFTSTPVSCLNGNDGVATATPSGGNPPYSYSWMPGGATINSISNVAAGTYTLTLSDLKGCSTTGNVTITQPPALLLNPTITNVVCSGENSGAIALAPTGGVSPYTYLWSEGNQTTSSIHNLSIGTYTVIVTDASGCQTTENYTITQLSLSIVFTTTHVSCFGGNDGNVSASPSGGTPNFTYFWTPGGATTNAITNLPAGTYTLSVTDSKGCVAQNSITITQPPVVSVTTSSTDKTCSNLNNGTVTALPAGGTPGYSYLWLPGLQTTATVTGLPIGTYTVNTVDTNGCTATATATVGQPAPLVANFTGQTNITTCYGANTGAVSAAPSGGTPSYSYSWMPGSYTTSTISNLSAGTYSLTITDTQGCVATNSVIITQPTQIAATTVKTNETCSYLDNGTASVTASGATPPYTYVWQPGNLTGNAVTGLSAATYSVTVTDSKGCTVEKTAIVTEPGTLAVNFSTQTNVSCNGGANGIATTAVSGGSPNFTYLWAPGGNTTATRNNLSAGTHTVTVTDSKGCTATNSITISEPPALTANQVSTNETCDYSNNGTATVTPSGGTPGYTYLWQPGLQTTPSRTALKAGTYTVTVKDSKGCPNNVLVTITEPPAMTVAFTAQTNVSCFGGNNGAVTASPSGGTPGYTYLWAPGGATTASRSNLTAGTYSVTVKDSRGCSVTKTVVISQPAVLLATMVRTSETCNYLNNGTATVSPNGGTPPYSYLWQPGGQTTKTATGLAAGTYSVLVTDAKGCTITRGVTVTEPATLAISFNNQNNVSCFGGNNGAVAATISGGTLNYSYSWAPGGQTTNARYNLTAGTYTLTVSDYYGCSTTNSVTITEPPAFSVSASSTPATCTGIEDGTLTSSASGGTSSYTYKWVPGNLTGQNASAVAAGTYTVIATDSKGCTATSPVVVSQPDSILVTAVTTNSGCNLATGSATITPSGGFPPYTYLWSPTGGTGLTASNLFSGHYVVRVTDSNGCYANQHVDVNDDSIPTLTVTPSHVSCIGDSTGSAIVVATGGYGTFDYLWLPSGDTTDTATGLEAGVHSIRVISMPNGCKAFSSVTITEPPALSINVSKTNVSCLGGSDGTASVNVYGGTPGYTYLWMPGGATTASVANLSANTYTVQVTDSNNCSTLSSQAVFTITEPTVPISFSVSSTPVSCFGKSTGTISATTATGGAGGPYSYNWSPGNHNGQNFIRLPAATYTLTVTDGKGCTQKDSTTVTQPTPLVTNFINQTNVSCFGGNNGSITVVPSGGTPGYTYYWIPGGLTTATIGNLKAGFDSVTVYDSYGCASGSSVIITQPTELLITMSKTNETCDYRDDGTATSVVSGGIEPYTYSWLPGGFTTSAITNLSENTYTLTVTDSIGCTTEETAAIVEPALLGITFTSQTEVSCFSGNDGAVTATSSGGTPAYTYSWLPGGETTNTITNLTANTYTLTVQDLNNCLAQSSVVVTQAPAALSATLSGTDVTCFGGTDGNVYAAITGGTAPYNSSWAPGNYNGDSLSNLAAGTYTLTVTDSKGCTLIDSVSISQPTAVVITPSSINANCGLANGQATANVSGGVSPYSYEWSPVGGTNALATGLGADNYIVTVTDSNQCVSIMTVGINDDEGPTAVISATTNINCYGDSDGTATLTVTSGVGPFTYSWLPAGGADSVATGLAAGTYTVTVTDSNSCQSKPIISPEITESFPIFINLSKTHVSCFGGNNGSASVTAAGGKPGYSYLWLPGGSTGTSISNLSSGTYTVQVTDSYNCIQTLQFTIEQTDSLAVALYAKSTSCYGETDGELSASVTGGTAPYNYSWMPGNLNGQNLSNLAAGTYTVSIVDLKGCSINDTIDIIQPDVLSLVPASINSNCSLPNGQASVTVTGGTLPYSYDWAHDGSTTASLTGLIAATYTVTVTDSNACFASTTVVVNDNPSPVVTLSSTTNVSCKGGSDGTASVTVAGNAGPFTYLWSPSGGTNDTAAGLSAGTYAVTVTDTNSCQSVPDTIIVISEPSIIDITVNSTSLNCFGYSDVNASVTAAGGTPGYTYQWLPSGTTGSSITSLAAGTYTVEVTDANNCVENKQFTVTQPSPLTTLISSVTNVSCFGGNNGSASVTAGGGAPVYSYQWLPSGGNGPVEQGLSAGTHTVTITDFKGCTTVDSVTISEPAQALTAASTVIPITCLGSTNGSAYVTPSGGTPGYSYQWNPSVSSTNTATGLSSGNYSVLVTDTNSCQTNIAIYITEPSLLVASLVAVNPSCSQTNGSISAQVSGGTPPYTYSWSTGQSTSSASGLGTGMFSVLITDASGCVLTLSATLMIAPDPIASITYTDSVTCSGGSDGVATVAITNGVAPFTINWYPSGGNNLTTSALTAGTYTVTVTDALGCQASDTTLIYEPDPVTISTLSITDALCKSQNTGSAEISVSGGTGSLYTYAWLPSGATTPTATGLSAGTHTVSVTDQHNCPAAISIIIAEPDSVISVIDSVSHPVCFNGFGNASVFAEGGVAPYNFLWIPTGDTTSVANNIHAGTYTVTVSDANGCNTNSTVTITQPTQIITSAGANDTICVGQSGSLSATATGGAGTYIYAWQPSGAITAGTLNITMPTSDVTYTVVAYDQIGCSGTPATISAIVYTLDTTSVKAFATSPICPGQSSVVYAEAYGNTGDLTYQWNNGLGTGAGVFVVTPSQPIQYIVIASNACASVSDTVNITFNPPPVIGFSSDTNALCVPGAIQFSDNSVTSNPNDPITGWFWNFGDGSTSAEENPLHTYNTPSTFPVTLTITTSGGCTSNNNASPLTISGFPFPAAAFSVNATNLNLPYDILNTNNQSTGATNYVWNFGDGTSSITFQPQHLFTSVGIFQVQLIAVSPNGCRDTAYAEVTTDADVVFPSGFTPNMEGSTGGAYDINSMENNVFFPYTSGVTAYHLQIYNRWGEMIFETRDIKQGWDGYYNGKLCQQDAYIWRAFIELNNGKTFEKNGSLTLLH